MDELVIATSWDDVVPVPEPSVSALFGGLLAGCLIILRRRIR
ncbi:MAG: PEP-CTERM sorting domain-containing protein [Oceanipulchritudo sp.]